MSTLALKLDCVMTLTDFWWICPRYTLTNSQGVRCTGPDKGKTCLRNCPEFSAAFISQRLKTSGEILNNAVGLASPSHFLASIFEQQLPGLAIKVINHGMSCDNLKPNKLFGKAGDRLVFGFAGAFASHKGIHILIEAVKEIDSDRFVLRLYGAGSDEQYVNSLYQMSANDRRIEFCGVFQPPQVGEVLSRLDALVVPSTCYENYPLVLHEALACHTPVIASNIGGMAEKIVDGVNGLTFPVGDKAGLKQDISKILSDPGLLNGIKANLKDFFPNTIEQEACAYQEMYENTYE
jgi:glycosyltransferase involved in cell wall biosynthesis